MSDPGSDTQPLPVALKALLASAGALAVVAGPVLFLFPHDTRTYFAWTIGHPLTPVFMGASYFAGIGALWAIRLNRWAVARVIVPSIFVFGLSQLIATLLHLDIFNWSHPIAWAWLAIYVFSPPATLALFLAAERRYPKDPGVPDLPPAVGPAMSFYAGVFGLAGVALFLLPGSVVELWPWSLTPLTSRVVGGWYLASSALAVMLSRERNLGNARIGMLAVALVSVLLLIGAALHASDFDGPSTSIAAYIATTFVYGASAAVFWWSARRSRTLAPRR